MWLDYATFVNPKEMIAVVWMTSCSENAAEQILKFDIRALLTPLDDSTSPTVPSFYPQADKDLPAQKHTVEFTTGEEYNFPDRWISFILSLPSLFPNHPAQCIVDKVDKLWDCVLHRLTLAGAQSFSAWWITKVFFHEMLRWQVEKGGFMKHSPSSLQIPLEASDLDSQHHAARQDSFPTQAKEDSFLLSESQTTESQAKSTKPNQFQDTNSNSKPMNEITSNLSENMTNLHANQHDDSAIGLEEDSMLASVGKYDIMTDATDANGDIVVI
jgi:regulatory factor X